MLRINLKRLSLCAMALAMATTSMAMAQSYPSKPIRLVVPFAAGGTTDVLARLYGQKMSATLGQPVVVENKAGAATMIGAEAVIKSAPDGYTLFLGTPSVWLNPLIYKKAPYKFEDFTAISSVARAPFVFDSSPVIPAKNVREFIEYAKNNPNKMSYASNGTASQSNLVAKLFEKVTGVAGVEVPYRGAAQGTMDIMSGEVHYYFDGILTSIPHHRAGKMRILAVASEERSAAAPDIPTFKEQGFPRMVAETIYGIFAPAGTPRPIVMQLGNAIIEAAGSEDLRSKLLKDGTVPVAGTPEQFADIIKKDYAVWSDVIKSFNIQLE